MSKIKSNDWTCRVNSNGKKSIDCESKRGQLLTAFDDGTVRFSTDKDQVRIDGKVPKSLRGQVGVELS